MVSERGMARLSARYEKSAKRMSKPNSPLGRLHDLVDGRSRRRWDAKRREDEERERR